MNVYICMYIYVIFRYMQKDFIMQGLAKLNKIETTMLRQFGTVSAKMSEFYNIIIL